jgi:hypothetical protein
MQLDRAVTKLLLTGSTQSDQSHTAVIDTIGYDSLQIGVAESTVSATNGFITFKIGHGDTTTAYTDVATNLSSSAIAATTTSVPNTYQINVDTRTLRRYLLLTVTPYTTKTLTSWVTLGNADIGPQSADNSGVRSVYSV